MKVVHEPREHSRDSAATGSAAQSMLSESPTSRPAHSALFGRAR
jgi:hypothetical protein